MKKVLIALLAVPALADEWEKFKEFKEKYNISFQDKDEDAKRFEIFKTNMARAAGLNGKSNGTATYGMTKFSHLSPAEFKEKHTGFKKNPNRKRWPKKIQPTGVKAGSIDWRTIGGVTPVKDQGQCGSCWAFSATQAAETGYYKATGDLKVLSPQQTVSCDRSDLACNGGDTSTAYEYMENAGGVERESDYPYVSGDTGVRGTCRAESSEFAVKVTNFHTISDSEFGETDMYTEIQNSPMSICVDASSWQMYMGGVVDSTTCGTSLDHCVHLVGMKADDFWIVKNSWNTDWGEDGYIRVATGQNACGIAEEATVADADYEAVQKGGNKKSAQNWIDVIMGLSEGFGLHMEEKCVSDSTAAFDQLEAAYKKMQEKNPVAMMEAMKMIAEALKVELPAAMNSCEATEKELHDIIAALEIMKHPASFMYHVEHNLEVNGIDIYNNMNDSVGHFKKKEYHDGGYSLGTALGLLLVGKPTEQVVQDSIYV